jgi:hypothetical protein
MPPPQTQPAQPKQGGSFQNSKAFIIIPIVLIIIVIAAGSYLITNKHAPSTSSSITIVPTTTLTPANTPAGQNTTISHSTVASTTILNVASSTNKTITLAQISSALGSGWKLTYQYANLTGMSTQLENGTDERVSGIGLANFGKGNSILDTSWIDFENDTDAIKDFNMTLISFFADTNPTAKTLGNSTYVYYTNSNITGGTTALYAYDGRYVMTIYETGGTFNLTQGKQLLSNQLTNLGIE